MAMRCSPADGLVQRTVRQKLLLVGTGFLGPCLCSFENYSSGFDFAVDA